jgi:hypothetical protein
LVYDDLPDDFIIEKLKGAFLAADPTRTVLVINPSRFGYWDSINLAINNHCGAAEIISLLSINDELLGFNVFSSINSAYQIKNANVVYSNFLEYHRDVNQVLKG